ncbi:MAG: ABC transporter ATP-binding protein [Candidatus Rokuibacteriota bacterium]
MKISLKDVTKTFGRVTAVDRASLEIIDGELFTLLGPSGCGKTTLLRLLAGFGAPDGGEIWFGERRVEGLRPYERNIGMVFQNYALWPHMTVKANITYGLKLRRLDRQTIARRLAEALDKVNLAGLEARYPGQLSGGQQQRVALARALVLNPDILLLDEPLSNLDAKIRVQVRAEIRKLQKELGITTVYVTHDQEEALSLSDRVAVMREGRVLQLAPPKTLYERPVNRFVADFVGTNNLLAGVCRELAGGWVVADTAIGPVRGCPNPRVGAGDACVLAVRPENVALGAGHENTFEARVVLASYLGNTLRYEVEVGAGAVLKVDVGDPWHHEVLPSGTRVRVTFPASAALTLPDE